MNEYEVIIEEINPCGGERYANKKIIEVEAESPESYIARNGRFPIMDIGKNLKGDVIITTGDGKGNIVGGLGVSGGTEEQDTALALYGKQIFENSGGN